MTEAAEGLARQFTRAWAMFRGVVGLFDDHEWRAGEPWQLVPARWAFHTVEAADFYLRATPEEMEWGSRFGADWEGAPAEKLPSQSDVLAYLAEVEVAIDRFMREMHDEAMYGPNTFGWTGETPFERMLYVLRHTLLHIGDINCIARHRGIAADDCWH